MDSLVGTTAPVWMEFAERREMGDESGVKDLKTRKFTKCSAKPQPTAG